MEIIIHNTAEEASKHAGEYISNIVKKIPDTILGLATGGTPVQMYKEMIRQHKENNIDYSQVTSFNLDEYIGLPPTHDQSYRYFMNENLFNHINIDKQNTHVPDGMATDIPKECENYEQKIFQAGGIDLQLLGVGTDGHIGFNEPGSSFASRTRIKTLTKQTREDNARFFNNIDEVPIHCITMGIETIIESNEIILLAFGKNKAEVIRNMIEGPISAELPASALHLHPNVKIFIDEDAASKLKRKEYYKYVYSNKPQWQQF